MTQQQQYDNWNKEIFETIISNKGNKLNHNELSNLFITEHSFLQDLFLRGKSVKEVSGILWLKGLTKRNY
jgi:hypothetical protein